MNFDKIRAGDIVVFEREGKMLHGRVSAKGYRYVVRPFVNTDEPILFIRVIEHPEWKEITLSSKEVKNIITIGEVVHFT